jgi:hypothetical protein
MIDIGIFHRYLIMAIILWIPRAVEIKDAKLIFNQAWKNIEDHYGRENIHLPREFIFLMGAPG